MHLLAPGKINLTLDILDRRPDGYHNISSVMQTIQWADGLEIDLTDRPGTIELTVEDRGDFGGVPADETNLVYRAAIAILKATESKNGARIRLEKWMPHQAGLGGGSSDAAATLAAINRLLGNPLSRADLVALAIGLGGDVPFFLTGGTCLVEGIGERVTPLTDISPRVIAIVKPDVGVPTALAYAALDQRRAERVRAQPSAWDGVSLRNDFEEAIEELYPAIRAAKRALIDAGCKDVHLCGSGSAVFGFVDLDDGPLENSGVLSKIGQRLSRDLFHWVTTMTATRAEAALP